MKLTNRLNLPQPLVDAVKNDSYSSGGCDISVTTLLRPPRAVVLEQKHWNDIEEDASDRIWSLIGQVVHGILERADKTGVTERRLSIQVDDWSVSGQMDRYSDGVLQDYKVSSVYKFSRPEVDPDFVKQLNIYAEILRANGFPVHGLQIVGILRDWSKNRIDDYNYPQTQVVTQEVPVWSSDVCLSFIRERVALHKQARIILPECTEEDRWAKPDQWALMRKGGKRAIKLFQNKQEAEKQAWSERGLFVEDRPGEKTVRCGYCSASKFCSQFKQLKGEN